MAVMYKLYQNNRKDSKTKGKWYARAIHTQMTETDVLAERIQRNCTVKRSDVLAVLSELVETELLRKRTISNSSYYEITEEGKKTLSYFEKELSGEIKNEVKDYLQTHGGQVQERILTPADYYTTPQGNYAVRCQIIEKDTTVLDLTLAAPGREAAQAMCHSWAKKSQDIYGMLMGELI